MSESQRIVLQIVFDVFHQTAEWPAYAYVDRQLYRRGLQSADSIASLPLELARFDRYHPRPGTIELTIAGLAAVDGADADLTLFVRTVRWLGRREAQYEPPSPTDPGRVTVTSTKFLAEEGLDLDRLQLARILALVRVEPISTGSGGPADQDPVWQITVDESIRPYAAITSVDDYLAIKRQMIEEASQRAPAWRAVYDTEPDEPIAVIEPPGPADPTKVFVVYGRNDAARIAMFELLRAFGLHPLEWSELRAATGKPSPYIGEILDAGFAISQACVILMTPDEEVQLRAEYVQEDIERIVSYQPRPNVLLEAGMALDKYRDRTVIVELGRMRQVSDLAGIHTLRMNDSLATRKELAERLHDARCDVRLDGTAWQCAGRFEAAVGDEPPTTRLPAVDTESERERDRVMAQLRHEYILSHDNITPGMAAGTESLPAEWLARRLSELRLATD